MYIDRIRDIIKSNKFYVQSPVQPKGILIPGMLDSRSTHLV